MFVLIDATNIGGQTGRKEIFSGKDGEFSGKDGEFSGKGLAGRIALVSKTPRPMKAGPIGSGYQPAILVVGCPVVASLISAKFKSLGSCKFATCKAAQERFCRLFFPSKPAFSRKNWLPNCQCRGLQVANLQEQGLPNCQCRALQVANLQGQGDAVMQVMNWSTLNWNAPWLKVSPHRLASLNCSNAITVA